MGDLNREHLVDLPTQRFQENVARKNRSIDKSLSTNSKDIEALTSTVTSSSSQITSIENKVNSFFTAFIDITFSIGTTSRTLNHNLGSVPKGWFIIDQVTTVPTSLYVLNRVSWDATTISVNSFINSAAIITYKIRVFI